MSFQILFFNVFFELTQAGGIHKSFNVFIVAPYFKQLKRNHAIKSADKKSSLLNGRTSTYNLAGLGIVLMTQRPI